MNTPHSPFGAPRKELINGLQKGVVILLFVLLLAFAGMYSLMNVNLQKQGAQQEKLSQILGLVHSAEEHSLAWLLSNDSATQIGEEVSKTSTSFYEQLLGEYRLLSDLLQDFELTAEIDVSDSLSYLESFEARDLELSPLTQTERKALYLSFEYLESIDEKLLQLNVSLDYEREMFVDRLIWVPVGIYVLLAGILILMASRFGRQLQSGFSVLHGVIDHRRSGHLSVHAPRNVVDEFSDLSHLVDNELSSRDFDIEQQAQSLVLMEKSLAMVSDIFLVTDEQGDIAWLSVGAEKLWFKNTAFFESLLGIDAGLDDPIGERAADSILFSDQELKLTLADGVYWMSVRPLIDELSDDPDNLQRFISIYTKSEQAELTVLHSSLKLLEQDVWNAPIRVMREDSPYATFATSLEVLRKKVVSLFDSLSVSSLQTHSSEKITKLQQIASLIDEKTNHNDPSIKKLPVVEEAPLNAFVEDLNDVAWHSTQVRDSLILGFELVLQRLALVEKDLSSDVFLLEDVDRCLNEVRAGVLSSLAATEGESEKIRHRFAVDIEHDISKVQEQIDEMKSMAASTLSLLGADRSVGLARLDRAKESINEMLERIQGLIDKTTLPKLNNSNKDESFIDSNNELDEF